MKLTYLHQYFATPDSSGGTRSYDLAKKFIEAGHEVTIISTDAILPIKLKAQKDRIWTVREVDGIKLHITSSDYSNNLSFFRRKLAFLKFALLSSWRCITISSDGMLATSTPLTIAIPALVYKFICRKDFIFEVRDVWPELPIAIGALNAGWAKWFFGRLEKETYKFAKHIVALSPGMKESICSRFPEVEKKTSVITNIAHLSRFENPTNLALKNIEEIPQHLPWTTEPVRTIAYIGTYGLINDVCYLPKLMAQMKVNEAPVLAIMIGNGAEFDILKETAENLGVLNSNLFLLPSVSKSQIPNIFGKLTAGMVMFKPLPEMEANSANKFFDLLAAGIPPIINYGGWQRELLKKHKFGLTLPIGRKDADYKVAASQLESYLLCNKQLKSDSKTSKRLAKSDYSLEVASVSYLKIFKSIFE